MRPSPRSFAALRMTRLKGEDSGSRVSVLKVPYFDALHQHPCATLPTFPQSEVRRLEFQTSSAWAAARRFPVGERHREHLRAADPPRPPGARRVPADRPLRALARGPRARPGPRAPGPPLGGPLVPGRAAAGGVRLELHRRGDPLYDRGAGDHPHPRPHALRLSVLAPPGVRELRLPARRGVLRRRLRPPLPRPGALVHAAQRADRQRPLLRRPRPLAALLEGGLGLPPHPAAARPRHPADGAGAQGGRPRRGHGARRGHRPLAGGARRPPGPGGRGPAARLPRATT